MRYDRSAAMEIEEGVNEYEIEKTMLNIRNHNAQIAVARQVYPLLRKNVSGFFTRIWIERVYKSSPEIFASRESLREMVKKCNLFKFMEFEINDAMAKVPTWN